MREGEFAEVHESNNLNGVMGLAAFGGKHSKALIKIRIRNVTIPDTVVSTT